MGENVVQDGGGEMKRIRVEFELVLPCDATDSEVDEWVRYEIGANGQIKIANPLSRHDLEADFTTVVITDTQ